MIDEQFGAIRANAGKERERTAAALRAAYDQAAQDVETIFDQSTHRFQAAAEEMRGLSRTIQQELTATRDEVRRHAAELPRETAEQAATMRRVVTDQVNALNDLTSLVTKAGRSLDLSQPEQIVARASDPSPREYRQAPAPLPMVPETQELRRREPRREQVRQELTRQELTRQEPTRQEPARQESGRQEPPRQASRPAPQQAARSEPQSSSSAAPCRRPRHRPPQAPRPGQGDRTQGWLTDLLARASEDDARFITEPSRTNGRGTEPLEAITTDIARMIDADAANDAWESYRRGDERAFDRSIYKGKGAQTFDDISRRYGRDGDFRMTVDRYVQEFERLLSQIQNDDPDDRMLRGYLASDSGKVYTMLAHAAGRLA
jgi:hypothetical protein